MRHIIIASSFRWQAAQRQLDGACTSPSSSSNQCALSPTQEGTAYSMVAHSQEYPRHVEAAHDVHARLALRLAVARVNGVGDDVAEEDDDHHVVPAR